MAEKRELNEYVGRTTLLLRGGYTRASVGIVYPIESLWTCFTPVPMKVVDGFFTDPDVTGWDTLAGGSPEAILVEQTFRNVSRFMFKNRWEYSYLDSKAIIDASIEDDELVHGKLRWKVIVLPAVSTLPREAWDRLAQFIQAGGTVISLELMPENSEDHFPDPDLKSRMKELLNTRDNAIFIEHWTPAKLKQILLERSDQAVQLEDETQPLRIAHRKVEGKEVFYIINDSEKTIRTGVILMAKGNYEEWDPATGEVIPVSSRPQIELLPYHGKIYRSK